MMIKKHITIFSWILGLYAGLQASEQDEITQGLLYAVQCGNEKVVTVRIGQGANVNFHDPHGWTMVHEAVQGSSTKILQELIDAGADIDEQVGCGNRPLRYCHWSANSKGMAALLLRHGAGLTSVDKRNRTALLYNSGSELHPGSVMLVFIAQSGIFGAIS